MQKIATSLTDWTIVKQNGDQQGNQVCLMYTDVDTVSKPYIKV